MTDAEIIRTLAEFMGYQELRMTDRRTGFSAFRDASGTIARTDWLTSYDAIAEVWQRVHVSHPVQYEKARADICNQCGCPFGAWVYATPREHAEALATAIRAVKEPKA